jgi:hypothetical protein
MVFGLSGGIRNPGDSKKSKFEAMFEDAIEKDAMYARQVVLFEEFEKL